MTFTVIDLVDLEPKIIVCEGDCNPDLSDYDESRLRIMDIRRIGAISGTLGVIINWGRRIKHTQHLRISHAPTWDTAMGWCNEYKCVECGHVRRF